MDVSPDRRCRRKSCQSWSCSEMATQGNLYCEKHYLQTKKTKLKRPARESEGEESFVAGDEIVRRGVKTSRTGDHREKIGKNPSRGLESGGSDDHASETEIESNRIPQREQVKQFSTYKTQKADKKTFNSRKELTESGNRLSKSGGGQNNAVKSRGLVERKPLIINKLDEATKNMEPASLTCHQCKRSDKNGVVFCSNCKRKRYCYECIAKWYPEKTRQEIESVCPFCCGNCNCKACLREYLFVKICDREVDASTKLMQLKYMLHKALPVLRHICGEQNDELEIESKLRGIQLTGKDITRSKLGIKERLYWYF